MYLQNVCDILHRASRALVPYWHLRCILMIPSAIPSASQSASTGPRFKVMLGFFASKSQPEPIERPPTTFCVLWFQLSSELAAELKSLLRTAYQGCLGGRECMGMAFRHGTITAALEAVYYLEHQSPEWDARDLG